MGITFKENCPDMRNTKVLDIIKELESYGCCVDVYDPWIDKNETIHYKNINWVYTPFNKNKKYDSIVLAVGHSEFKKLKEEDYQNIVNGQLVLIDVKGITDNPTWKL